MAENVEDPASVAELAGRWTATVASRDPAARRASDGLPLAVHPRRLLPMVVEAAGQRMVRAIVPGDTGTDLAGAGVLELPLNDREIAYLHAARQERLLALTDADVAHLEVSRVMFLRIAMNITEHAFTRLVMAMAEAEDVLVHHCGSAAYCRGGRGFPDLVLGGCQRVLFAELKRIYDAAAAVRGWGVRTPEQVTSGQRLADAAEYVLWTPADLLHIRARLRTLHISHLDELLADAELPHDGSPGPVTPE